MLARPVLSAAVPAAVLDWAPNLPGHCGVSAPLLAAGATAPAAATGWSADPTMVGSALDATMVGSADILGGG